MANPAHRSGSDEECDTGYSPLKDQTNRQPPLTIEEIKKGIFSTDFKEAFKATQAARKILSRERNPPIDVLIDAGIGKIFFKKFRYSEKNIKFENISHFACFTIYYLT